MVHRLWGIEIVAENKEDEKLLKVLWSQLPSQAKESYEDGEVKAGKKTTIEFVEQEGYTLTFHR